MKAALRWLQQQAQDVQLALRRAENEVAEFSATMDLINEASLFTLQRELKELRGSIVELAARRPAQPDRLGTLRKFEVPQTKTLVLHNRDFLQRKTLKRQVNDLRFLSENINTERLSPHLSSELSLPEITLLSAAEVSLEPSSPQPRLLLLMGFCLGILSYLFARMSRDPFASVNQVLGVLETQSRQPVLGYVPAVLGTWNLWRRHAEKQAPYRWMEEARVIAKVLNHGSSNTPIIVVLGVQPACQWVMWRRALPVRQKDVASGLW